MSAKNNQNPRVYPGSINDIRKFLNDQGYSFKDNGNYLQLAAFWRGGSDPTSVVIYPDSNIVVDFVEGAKYHTDKLIKTVLNFKSDQELNSWKKGNVFRQPKELITVKPKIKLAHKFKKEDLINILPIYDYALNRGISESVCRELQCGTVGNVQGRMKNRFTWPVFNSKGDVVGYAGRSLDNRMPKYFLMGEKQAFVYSAYVSLKEIQRLKTVIIVESPFDLMSLFECGIKNVICIFGIDMSLAVLNFLLRINPTKIIISTNNDSLEGGDAGNRASEKMKKRLCKYFDYNVVKVILPEKSKDWNGCLVKEGKESVIKQLF